MGFLYCNLRISSELNSTSRLRMPSPCHSPSALRNKLPRKSIIPITGEICSILNYCLHPWHGFPIGSGMTRPSPLILVPLLRDKSPRRATLLLPFPRTREHGFPIAPGCIQVTIGNDKTATLSFPHALSGNPLCNYRDDLSLPKLSLISVAVYSLCFSNVSNSVIS